MGGWLMIPLFLLSVLGIYIIVERWFALDKAQKQNRAFMTFLNRFTEGKPTGKIEDFDAPLAETIAKGMKYRHLSVAELRNIMENTANATVASLEKGLSLLATVSSIAPMIGFLGTVVGMVQAFYDMSLAGNNINITLLSRGIYTAMITTVAGLIIGIITLFGYNILVAKTNRIADEMDKAVEKFIEAQLKSK
jgi:biopolymer transport protein ExbB